MQDRHLDRKKYFEELATTARKHFVPEVSNYVTLGAGVNVLEIGCGDGGNLLPFAEKGCHVIGLDIAEVRVKDARCFFAEHGVEGTFFHSDIISHPDLGRKFDVVLCHDVYEHIPDKAGLIDAIAKYLQPNGIAFVAFPAWQMPFGGHQQICHSRIASKLPYIHLLPRQLYRIILRAFGENSDCVNELMAIKQTKTSIEAFERIIRTSRLSIVKRELWLINPHYEIKFGLHARKLNRIMSRIPWLRNFVSTSCGYMLKLSSPA